MRENPIYHLVPYDKRPWADGKGDLKKHSVLNPSLDLTNDMNGHGITVMVINDGKSPLTKEQTEALLEHIPDIMSEHNIPLQNMITLAEWAIGRHIAPTPYFPYSELHELGIGFWPSVDLEPDPGVLWSINQQIGVDKFESGLFSKFTQLGYSANLTQKEEEKNDYDLTENSGWNHELDPNLISMVIAFKLHYCGQEILESGLFNELWNDSSDHELRIELSTWNTNNDTILNDVLSQGAVEMLGSLD